MLLIFISRAVDKNVLGSTFWEINVGNEKFMVLAVLVKSYLIKSKNVIFVKSDRCTL